MPQARWLRHSNGRLFRIPTGFPNSINKAIFSWFAGCDCPGNPYRRGNPHVDGHSKKAAATLVKSRCSRFSATKITPVRTCRPMCLPSFKQFSWLTPQQFCMAFSDFSNDRLSPNAEPPRIQWRYRPGFTPGFLFSCGAVTTSTST